MESVKTYHNVNRAALNVQFSVKNMTQIYAENEGKTDAPHRHDYYTILLIEHGNGIHKVDFNQYTIEPQQLYFVSPGQVHQIIEHEASRGYVITFSTDFLSANNIPLAFIESLDLFRGLNECPPIALQLNELSLLKNYCGQLEQITQSNMQFKANAIAAYLQLFLIRCNNLPCFQQSATNHSIDASQRMFQSFKALINENYSRWHKVQHYSDAMAVSADHLNKVIKAMTGKTCKEHIQDRIIVAAKRLLFFTDSTTQEIAFELGFEAASNFSAFFKNCVGESPTNFRAREQG